MMVDLLFYRISEILKYKNIPSFKKHFGKELESFTDYIKLKKIMITKKFQRKNLKNI